MAHDNGSSLVGENIGLSSLLKKENLPFFALKDPCHGLNLVAKHALNSLPYEMVQFVQNISSRFSSPQRKAQLKKLQEENGGNFLYPKKLAFTRWLSFGDCLGRIIDIWGSLQKYYEFYILNKKDKKENSKNKENNSSKTLKLKSKDVDDLLNNETFYLQMYLLNHFINTLNRYNIKFQSQKASVSEIKRNLHECYYSLLDLVLKSEIYEKSIGELLIHDWESTSVQENFFVSPPEFISNLTSCLSSKFSKIGEDKNIQEGFSYVFMDFIGKILNLLKEYLPYDDKLVDILDFVTLKDPISIFKKKLMDFCEFFKLLKEKEKPMLQEELVKLKNVTISNYQDSSSSILHMWDRLQSNEKLNLIPKIAYFAETLPTTSAGLEQSFSQVKLLKTDIRNRLSEETLEGLMFVTQEITPKSGLNIDEKVLTKFIEVRKKFNEKRVVKKENQNKSKNEKTPLSFKENDSPQIEVQETFQNMEIEDTKVAEEENKKEESDREDDLLDDDRLNPVGKKVKGH